MSAAMRCAELGRHAIGHNRSFCGGAADGGGAMMPALRIIVSEEDAAGSWVFTVCLDVRRSPNVA